MTGDLLGAILRCTAVVVAAMAALAFACLLAFLVSLAWRTWRSIRWDKKRMAREQADDVPADDNDMTCDWGCR